MLALAALVLSTIRATLQYASGSGVGLLLAVYRIPRNTAINATIHNSSFTFVFINERHSASHRSTKNKGISQRAGSIQAAQAAESGDLAAALQQSQPSEGSAVKGLELRNLTKLSYYGYIVNSMISRSWL